MTCLNKLWTIGIGAGAIAYHSIISERLGELREGKLMNWLRISTFLRQSIEPAARTYKSVIRFQDALSSEVASAASIVKTALDNQRKATEAKISITLLIFGPLGGTYYLSSLFEAPVLVRIVVLLLMAFLSLIIYFWPLGGKGPQGFGVSLRASACWLKAMVGLNKPKP